MLPPMMHGELTIGQTDSMVGQADSEGSVCEGEGETGVCMYVCVGEGGVNKSTTWVAQKLHSTGRLLRLDER